MLAKAFIAIVIRFIYFQFGPRYFYPVWTSFWALYHTLNLFLMPYYSSEWPNQLAWPLYLTNMGYSLLGIFSICDCVVTIYVYAKRPDILSGEYNVHVFCEQI
jgi:hypothetical protein